MFCVVILSGDYIVTPAVVDNTTGTAKMRSNGESGTIPSELGLLTNWKYVVFRKSVNIHSYLLCVFDIIWLNEILTLVFAVLHVNLPENSNATGPLPTEFGNMAAAEVLWLSKFVEQHYICVYTIMYIIQLNLNICVLLWWHGFDRGWEADWSHSYRTRTAGVIDDVFYRWVHTTNIMQTLIKLTETTRHTNYTTDLSVMILC